MKIIKNIQYKIINFPCSLLKKVFLLFNKITFSDIFSATL